MGLILALISVQLAIITTLISRQNANQKTMIEHLKKIEEYTRRRR